MVKESPSVRPVDKDPAHVGNVEDAGVGSHSPTLWEDAFKPDWKVETCIVDNVAMLSVILIDLGLLTHHDQRADE